MSANRPAFSQALATDTYRRLINNTLGDPEKAKRFVGAITAAVATNGALQECDYGSILAGALLGESLNLSPSPQLGQYYLVPFKDKKAGISKAQFILGYKGYIQLALRSGYYADLDVMEIRQGEYRGKDPTNGKPRFSFVEDDEARDKLPVVGYMAYFEYQNGFRKTIYWSKEKMMAHADKYSPAFSAINYKKILNGEIPDSEMWKYSSFWYKNFDEMAKKTMLRQLISKWGVMSTELQTVFDKDANPIEITDNGDFVTAAGETNGNIIPPGTQITGETDAEEKVNLDDI